MHLLRPTCISINKWQIITCFRLVNQAVKELQITEERIQKVIAGQTHSTVSKSLNTGLQEGTAELIKTAKALGHLKNSIESTSDQFSWKIITIILGIFAILMLGIIWLFTAYIEPLENISKIESLRQDGIQLDIRSCTVGKESKTCVRVMKEQCNYGKHGDLCVIDPK